MLGTKGRYRPYLEVVFSNKIINQDSQKTFAMVDSGADHTVIPYSVGMLIGLEKPTEREKLNSVNGVGGSLSYIERKCRIYVINKLKNKIYGFDETVWWIYPDTETQQKQQELTKTLQLWLHYQEETPLNTDIRSAIDQEIKNTTDNLRIINSKLEIEVLLGRPFFDNFDFIQFVHRDRSKEERCYFNYNVSEKKIVETITIPQQTKITI
jgi:hypothetical protein